jgi:predicted  nucleic acid-binding Zn-ribbon protein
LCAASRVEGNLERRLNDLQNTNSGLQKSNLALQSSIDRLREQQKSYLYEQERLKNSLVTAKDKTNEKDVLAKTHFAKIKELTLLLDRLTEDNKRARESLQ